MPEYEFYSPKGGNWAYFAKNVSAITKFVKLNEVQAIRVGPMAVREAGKLAPAMDLGIRGGIRVPHLHLKNKIYLLDANQWASFSQQVIADAQARLAKTKTIDFDQAMALGSVTQTLG
jgi:hypothetical protein